MSRTHGRLALAAAAAALLAGCNFSPAPEPTATLSPEQVLQTAQAIAEATLRAVTPTPAITDTPVPASETPILETATPEPSVTPSSPVLVAAYNANVRYGPGEEYPVVDFLLAGQSADIVGRYDDTPIGTWWLIQRTQGINGWIWSGAVEVSGSTVGVPVLEKPPTPTPTKGPSKTPGPTSAPSATPTETPTP
jgi:uncharacterized protein YgiM (DUF1202 family)